MENISKIKSENESLKTKISKLEKSLQKRIEELEFQNEELLSQKDAYIRSNRKLSKVTKLLKDEKYRAQHFLDIAGVIFIVLDKKGKIILANKKACQVLGYREEEVIGKNWFDQFIRKESVNEVKEVFQKILIGNLEPVEFYTNPVLNSKGEERIISWHNSVLKNEEGKIIGLLSSGSDITEKIESEQKYSSLFENMQEGVALHEMIFDEDDNPIDFIWLDVNPKYEEITHLKKLDIIGKRGLEIIPNIEQRWLDAYGNVAKTGKAITLADYSEYLNKYWEVRAFCPGKNLFAVAMTDITARINTEEELKQSEEKFKSLMMQSPFIVEVYDMNGLQISVNKAYEDMWDFPAETTLFKLNLFKSKEVEKSGLLEYIKRAYAGESVKVPEYEFDPRGATEAKGKGRVRWLDTRIYPIGNIKKEVQNIVITHQDITERKKAELDLLSVNKQLSFSEEKYRLITDNTSDVIWILDIEGQNFSYVSPSIERLLGYTPEEFINIGLSDVLGQQSLDYLARVVPERVARYKNGKREVFKDVFEQIRKDGENIWTEVHAHYFVNSKSGRLEALGSSRDITEKWKIQQALEQSEQEYRLLFNLLPYGGEVIDPKGNIIKCSPSTARMLGYEVDELVGQHISKILNKKSMPTFQEKFPILLKGKPVKADVILNHKSGKEIVVLRAAQPIMDRNNKVFSILALNVDITERVKVVRELINAKEKAEESDKLKSAFLANMSHEIRTPMNGILGFTELLKERDISESKHEKYVSIIRKSGNRMLDTVNNIIEISKIETNQIDLLLSVVNVNEIVEDHFNFFKPETDQKGLELNYNVGLVKTASLIRTDKLMLNSMLTNLIKNAVKYTKAGSISFGYSLVDGYLEFYVKDTGIGIAPNRQEAVFKRFIQADIEDKQAYEGSGLGLSIAYAYAHMLNGNMRVESQEGVGSTFYFKIPYQQVEDNKESNNTTIEDDKAKINSLKILVAEDDTISEMHLSILLKEIASEIFYARNGIEAVSSCKENPDIDLILMDIKMPKMDGYTATNEIRKFNKTVPIIAQSAYALQGDRERAIQSGCNEYITKPIEKSVLFNLINELIS